MACGSAPAARAGGCYTFPAFARARAAAAAPRTCRIGPPKMDYLSVVILGIVQGITEFLPISSDGHLAIAEAVYTAATGIPFPSGLELTIALHAGTLFSILVVFWRRVVALLRQDRRVIGLIIVGTLPLVPAALLLERLGEATLKSPLLTGLLLPVNGLILLWAARRPPGELEYQQISYRQALLIGLFQAIAPLPGISRSGSTIAAGLFVGLRREAAATFSFLLGLAALSGACVKYLLFGDFAGMPWQPVVLGAVVAFLVGVLALRWLLKWLVGGRLVYFAWWCFGLGAVVVVWQLAL